MTAAPKVDAVAYKVHAYREPDGVVLIEDDHWASPNCLGNITHIYTITDGRVTACDTIIHD